MKNINVVKRKMFAFIVALNFSANKMLVIRKDHTSIRNYVYYEEYQNIQIITS